MKEKLVLYIVDDEVGMSEFISYLVEDDHEIILCNSAEEALIKMPTKAPDILITDVQMLGMNGIDFSKNVLNSYADTLIIIVSGTNKRNIVIQALKLGVFDFVDKPINAKEFNCIMKRAAKFCYLKNDNLDYIKKLQESAPHILRSVNREAGNSKVKPKKKTG
jgi:DNA-binding NtrC family response regulator